MIHAVRFGYAYDRRTVSFVLGETWEWDGESECEETDSYQILWAREFRYDSGRARYLSRVLDSDDLEEGTFTVVSQVWSDFDGDETYGDYSLTAGSPPTATNLRSYQPGLAEVDEWVAEGADNTNYLVTDHLGTVRDVADDSGLGVSPAVFTAFGERISGDNRRHGYVGAFGYQSHSIAEATNPDTAFPFLHVGARYYDPSSGRFLQRDPIGIFGGSNSYAYVKSRPTQFSDPLGLFSIDKACVGAIVGAFRPYSIGAGPGGILLGAGVGFLGGYESGDFDRLFNYIFYPLPTNKPGWWDEFDIQDDQEITYIYSPPRPRPKWCTGPFCMPLWTPGPPIERGPEFRRNPNYCD